MRRWKVISKRENDLEDRATQREKGERETLHTEREGERQRTRVGGGRHEEAEEAVCYIIQ